MFGIACAGRGREIEQTIVRLARERAGCGAGLCVLRGHAFRPASGGAARLAISSRAQGCLEWTIGHPAVTAVTPALSQAGSIMRTFGGGIGRLSNQDPGKRTAARIGAPLGT